VRHKPVFLILSFLTFVFLSFGSDNDERLLDKVAIVVNGKPILESEIELARQWFGIKDRKEAAKRLIEQVIVSEIAEKAGIHVSGEEIEEAIDKLAKANGFLTSSQFEEKLKQQGIIIPEFKALIKREIMNAKFIQIYLRKNLFKGISEGKLEKVRIIRILYLKKDSPDFKEKYRAVKSSLGKEPFDKLAKDYSDDRLTADKGGLLGEVKKGDLFSKLDKAIWSHKVGDIFKVDTENGVYFVKIEKEEEKVTVVPITGKNIQKKLKKEFDIFLKKAKENTVIEYLDKSLM